MHTLLTAPQLTNARMGAGILQDLVVVMVIAAAVTILFYRLKQPVVLGYLLAGLLAGPHTLGLIQDTASIDGLAHLGLIFLMFAVGLEFDLKKLRKVGAKAAFAAVSQVSLMMLLGYEAGQLLGWSMMDSVFLGAVISISSTTIIVKVLSEMGKLKEGYSELAFGILIIEDVLAIVIVAVFTTLGATGSLDAALVGSTVGAVLLFVFIFVCIGLVVVPRLIDVVSRFRVEEVLVITVVGLAFAAALLAENLGFSIALGAFLMGGIIAESRAVRSVEHKVVPIRDLFSSMFFVAVGMVINPHDILAYWKPILLITAVTIVGKVVGVTVASFLVGYDGRTAVKTGTTLGQIGEFSFIIAGLGVTLGVVRPELHPIAVAVCAITSLTTPLLMRSVPPVTDRLAPRLPRWWQRSTDAYTRLVRRVGARAADPLASRDARRARHGTRVAIYAAWLFGLLLVAAFVSARLGAEVGQRLSLGDEATRSAAVGFLGLACLPIFVALVKATESYALHAAKAAAMDPRRLARQDVRYRRPTFVARGVASVAAIALLAVAVRVAWGVHVIAVPSPWLLVPILMTVALVGAFGWRHLERLYEGMERTLNELLNSEEDALQPDDRNKRLKERLPFGMDMEEVQIRPIDLAAYASLKSLSLREHTGATVLLVERGQQVVHNPHPDMVLLPHDRIILVGKRDQLDGAIPYLHRLARREAPIVREEMRIPASSPAVGRPFGALHLLEGTGALVGLVQKPNGRTLAPAPRVALEADDEIVVYGPEAGIERMRERLRVVHPLAPQPRYGPAKR